LPLPENSIFSNYIITNMRTIALLFLISMTITISSCSENKTSNENDGLVVKTANGWVEGTLEKSGNRAFKGVPFAAPPVGDLRWREPQPVKDWTDTLKADHFAPRAMQLPIFSDMNFRSKGMSEDCLYLNIWAPQDAKNLPVLVYFYGGGFVGGDGSEPRYEGDSIAKFGIVAITVNYRLGAFGFMAHPELTKESPNHASGNYGVLDQAAALQWVKNNIGAFGGDPAKVTIAGESAGSVSVSAQMASPLARDLIAGAIGESGSVLGTLRAVTLDSAEQRGVQFANSVGAKSLADLRAMNADTLLQATAKFRFPMTQDGYFFPKSPYAIFEAGEQSHVPLLAGWNSEEGSAESILGDDAPTVANFTKAVRKMYKENADAVLKVYHPASDAEVETVARDLASDRFTGFSTWKWTDIQAQTGSKPVYRYMYERPRPEPLGKNGEIIGPASKGASHSAEIEYAMGNLSSNKVFAWKADDYAVSRTIQQYFANFIKTGDPNGGGLPQWPAIKANADAQVMHIDVNTRLETEQHRNRYLLLDSLSKKQSNR
jgi:para-nitrobenzyl esterase